MNGTIYLHDLQEVAEFLAAFEKTDSTACFEVEYANNARGYAIRFTGCK